MSFFDFFRRFFVGPNESVPNHSDPRYNNDLRSSIFDSDDGLDNENDFRNQEFFSFNMYTDPIEIHRYFEQQMKEMLKNFHMVDPFQDFGSLFEPDANQFREIEQSPFGFFQKPPAIEGSKESPKSLREQILKPEFRRIESPADKVDTVLDGKIDASDVGKAFDNKDSLVPIWTQKDSERPLIPRRDTLIPNGDLFAYGRSTVTRMVRRPDGTIEREEVVKESDGTERKTVTRTLGDHEYSVTTVTDPSGVEQRTENYKNIDPQKLDDFNQVWDGNSSRWQNWWNGRKPFF